MKKMSMKRERSDFNFVQSRLLLFHLISLLEMHGKLRFSPEAIEKWNENDETKKLKQK